MQAAARHPYILLLLLFYSVAGMAAGVSAAGLFAAEAGGELSAFFGALPGGSYQVLPPFIRAAALNLLLYCLACLPRLWSPLLPIGALCVSLKGFCLGVSLRCLLVDLGLWGLALGLPLCILPALFCLAGLALRMLVDAREKAGLLQGGLTLRSFGYLAVCILLESAVAPVALRAFLRK
ncbi:MAG: hypothetical protein VB051_07965 [Candidatus Pelethousia sp.]|nr:hypothetical protein [Candidatus Pelethousia sp.]